MDDNVDFNELLKEEMIVKDFETQIKEEPLVQLDDCIKFTVPHKFCICDKCCAIYADEMREEMNNEKRRFDLMIESLPDDASKRAHKVDYTCDQIGVVNTERSVLDGSLLDCNCEDCKDKQLKFQKKMAALPDEASREAHRHDEPVGLSQLSGLTLTDAATEGKFINLHYTIF